MGATAMRKWVRRYGSREAALHARLRERRRRAFDRALDQAIQIGERTGVDPTITLENGWTPSER